MPRAASLPPDLKPFARRKAFRCAQEHSPDDLSLLKSKIENAVWEAELKGQRECREKNISAQAPVEDVAWAVLRKSDIKDLKKFPREFPDGAHAAEATKLLEVLKLTSRTNADDRLPVDPLDRVEGGDGIVEGRDVADVRPQSSVPHPLDDLTQLGTIGLDNEVDRQAVGGARLGRPDDGHQSSSGSNQACGPLLDVAADDIEHQIDAADVFQRVVVEVDELLRAEVERLLTVGSASGPMT